MAKIIIKNSEISSSAGINIPGNLSIAGDTVIGDVFTDSLVVNAHTTFNEDISAEEIVISSSFKGDGSQLHSLTASNISNFTNDVRSKFSAGTNITISNGVISSTAAGGTAGGTPGGTNQTVQFNSGSTFSGSASLIYNYTTNTLSGTTAEFTTVTASNVLIHGTASLFSSPQTAYVLYDSASDKVSVFPGLSVTGSITASGPTQLTTVSGTTAQFTNITGSTGKFIQLTSSNFYNSLTVGLGVAPTSNYRMIAKNASTNTANAIRVENTLNTIGMNIGINAANQGVLQADRDLILGGGTNYGITANSSREIHFNAGTNGAALGRITFTNQYVTVAAVPYNSYNFVISGTVGSTTQGRLQFANLGTAAAPLITQISDTNTGIYFPDADTVAISTNGTERLRITGSGDITVENISGTTAQFTTITASNIYPLSFGGKYPLLLEGPQVGMPGWQVIGVGATGLACPVSSSYIVPFWFGAPITIDAASFYVSQTVPGALADFSIWSCEPTSSAPSFVPVSRRYVESSIDVSTVGIYTITSSMPLTLEPGFYAAVITSNTSSLGCYALTYNADSFRSARVASTGFQLQLVQGYTAPTGYPIGTTWSGSISTTVSNGALGYRGQVAIRWR